MQAAYTVELTKRVHGLVSDEKNVAGVEAFRGATFIGVRLNDLLVADKLVDQGRLRASRNALLAEQAERSRRNKARDEQRERREQHDHERNLDVREEHERQRSQNCEDPGEELREPEQKSVGNLVDIGDDAAHDLTVAPAVEVGQRKAGDVVDGIVADVANGAEGYAVQKKRHEPGADGGDQHENARRAQEAPKFVEGDFAGSDDGVDGIADTLRHEDL